MASKLTLNDLVSETGFTTDLNDNFSDIETAFDNTLSRDGTSPNEMQADISMGGYGILNVKKGVDPSDVATVQNVLDGVSTTDTVLSTNSVGPWIYPLSSAESAAGITSTEIDNVSGWRYRPGDPRRYGGDGTGAADSDAALKKANSVGLIILEPGTVFYTLGGTLTSFTAPIISLGGKLKLDGRAFRYSDLLAINTTGFVTLLNSATFTPLLSAGTSNVLIGEADVLDPAADLLAVAIGHLVKADTFGVAIGYNVPSTGASSVAIGTGHLSSTAAGTVGIGSAVSSTANNAIAIGSSAEATGLSAIAIGYLADAKGSNNIAIGVSANAPSTANNSVTIGNSTVVGNQSVAVGGSAQANTSASVAIGYSAIATQDSIAIGHQVDAGAGTNIIAIGADEDTANTCRLGKSNQNLKFGVNNSALADSALDAATFNVYVDEVGNTLTFKVKYSDGTTVKSGTVALT